ncbi:HD domain-containing protein [Streptomyces pseudovenezuelae]|uniref:HD domain-containing protein n=1 Tax=Streptomyces pseudovenezuelae TaxID=67350 RepID=UPI0037182D5A
MAGSLLAEPLPQRWAHSQGVAARAQSLAGILGDDAEVLWAAAMLHDIGYTPSLAETRFHPVDGARYLRGRSGRRRNPVSATTREVRS